MAEERKVSLNFPPKCVECGGVTDLREALITPDGGVVLGYRCYDVKCLCAVWSPPEGGMSKKDYKYLVGYLELDLDGDDDPFG